MPSTTRTFIALPIPTTLDRPLTRLQAQLGTEAPGVRWTTTFPFHVTLAFLGDVLDADLNAVCQTVKEAARPFPPLECRLEGVGAFPSPARPRVVWAGLKASRPEVLNELQRAVFQAAIGAGYRPDDRFTPHVTLGRARYDRKDGKAADLSRLVESFRSWSGGAFTAREITTFSSALTPEGPIYAPLARAQLSGKKKTDVSP
jgi:2'-5' RNA ligase